MVSKINSIGILGMKTYTVQVEADVSGGKAKFDLVGLPDTAVAESRERVQSAIKNAGYGFPNIHITVNLAPADIRKEGPIYDLPIFIALLVANRQLGGDFKDCAFIGELSLGGELRHINGVLPMVICARDAGFKEIFVPNANALEASVVEGIDIYAPKNVSQIIKHIKQEEPLEKVENCGFSSFSQSEDVYPFDFSEVKGQVRAKRALEVAASGGHNVMMIGPPGSGKSMLAKRLPTILPSMSFEEALETTKIYSICGAVRQSQGLITTRPFRAPHHTVSPAGLSGGGAIPKPGEISLAHNGVLFLDEMPEFSRAAMEIMRQPIEDGAITISRAAGALTYPCSVMLVCAMNPCPCGYYGHPTRSCICGAGAAAKYLSRVSGPLLDRIDIHIDVPPVDFLDLNSDLPEESSAEIKKRVDAARDIQRKRFEGTSVSCNAKMTPELTKKCCIMSKSATDFLAIVFDRLGLSARAYDRIIKVSRTIADLDGSENIELEHITEAVQYRSLDRAFYSSNE